MRKMPILSAAVLSVTIGLTAMAAEPKEEKIKLDAAPAAVQGAITKAVGNGQLGDVVRESMDGKTVFEAEFTVDKVQHSVKVSETGDVIEEEMGIDVKDLPAAVSDALKAKYANGVVEEATLVKAGGKTFYEVGIESDDVEHEVKIDAAGKILEDNSKTDEEDEGNEKDEKGGHHDSDKK